MSRIPAFFATLFSVQTLLSHSENSEKYAATEDRSEAEREQASAPKRNHRHHHRDVRQVIEAVSNIKSTVFKLAK